ncbi:3-ketoacyl-thiolase [Colletotrichum sojae]|uniref:3-ketoacyl-thiolase n=1 Tax=Colletotrichum sojae TaxID=2175907 RepID=A0A8H6IUU4_9PEZI|nr:3-ketoacyl-thiolase [Colletotrichum sojae]
MSLPKGISSVLKKAPSDVVILSSLRTPICRSNRGQLKDAYPEELLSTVLKATLEANPNLDPAQIEDVAVGVVLSELGGSKAARMAMNHVGYPNTTSLYTVNRACSSSLQSIALVASQIRSETISVGIGAGMESMTRNYGSRAIPVDAWPALKESPVKDARDCVMPMGITSENVAERYGVSRADQDAFAVRSHKNAARAREEGAFAQEIVPVTTRFQEVDKQGNKVGEEQTITVTQDDGIRATVGIEALAKLKPAFKPDGASTAGNSSQVSDGAAATLLIRRSTATELGLTDSIIGKFVSATTVGCAPDEMGIGPALAIPKLLDQLGLENKDVARWEINEAFASQAIYCLRALGLEQAYEDGKVNPDGGAIALGHPLGATGARMTSTLLHGLGRSGGEVGVPDEWMGICQGCRAAQQHFTTHILPGPYDWFLVPHGGSVEGGFGQNQAELETFPPCPAIQASFVLQTTPQLQNPEIWQAKPSESPLAKMEVVGAVASFIAIAQALETGGKIVNVLAGDTRDKQRNDVAQQRETAQVQIAAALEDEPEPSDLKAARLSIEKLIKDMQTIVTRCTRAVGKDGKIKPNYLKWMWLQKELKGCHDKTRDAKSSLGLAFLTLNLKQTTHNNQVVLRIEGLVMRHVTPTPGAGQLLLPAPNDIEESQPSETEETEQEIRELSSGPEQLVVADRRKKTSNTTSQEAEFDMIAFKAKLWMRGRCKRPCPCRCHGQPTSTFRTANWARNLVGSLFVSYDRLPLFGGSAACTEADCKGNTQTSTTFTYQFPTWLCSRYVSLQTAMNSSVGLRLRPVRILATTDDVWFVTQNGQRNLLKFIKNTSLIYPDDADSGGETLLDYAIYRAPGEALAFLVQLWGEELRKDSFNPAHQKLYKRLNMTTEEAQALQVIISIGEDIVNAAETPLHEAALLDGTDDEIRQQVREAAEQCAWAVGRWNNRGQTPLHVAAENGNLAAVKELVHLRCNLEQRDYQGRTALMQAARYGHTAVARLLLDAGCCANTAAPDGMTAMHFAALPWEEPKGSPAEMLRILLSAGAAMDARDQVEETALYELARSRATEDAVKAKLRVLVEAGADINAFNNMGDTPLMMSIRRDRLPPLQAFIEAGAPTKYSNLFGRNLLHLVALNSGIQVLEYLTTVETLEVDHKQLDICGDSPWDDFIWALHTPEWDLAGSRKPGINVQDAFVALFQCLRDRNLQFDIDALERVRQYLTEPDGRGAAAALAPLIKRKQEWKRQDELRTYNVVALQIRDGMWEGALEAVDENIELLLEEMDQSPWDQESSYDHARDWYENDSDVEEDEDDCATIDDEESVDNGHRHSDEDDSGSHEGDTTG